ncbi:MAG: ExbD/TolR family protein [Deltaproteobacteria bacterium]|nr:ExbD/TolR family protein [Deltaproteobacteria bacterium]
MMSDINVTPFVDVMLVLLIIFMVTAPLLTTGLKVDLPRVDAPPIEMPEEQVLLVIDAQGRYFLADHEFTFAELEEKIPAIAKANPDQEVFLQADGTVPYARVAELMGLCTRAGIVRMGMVTAPAGPEETER